MRLAALVLCAGCASSPPPAPTPPAPPPPVAAAVKPPAETLAADTPRATSGGATFTAPAGWSVVTDGALTVLELPERDSRVGIADVEAKDADAAVASAWKLFHPGFERPLHLATPAPARDGWDEIRGYDYETSPNERLVVAAEARRHGSAWTVILVEATLPSVGKRGAQLALVDKSLRPKGYDRESFAGRERHRLDAERIAKLGELVEKGRALFGIPGVAVALIEDGKVVFSGGFGVRELGKAAKIDGDTLFLIASNTKALTTLLLARLVDQGKLAWETPVVELWPDFKLGDPDTTRRVLVKHLVCACTGLPRQDYEFLFEFAHATPASEMALLGTFQPTTGFGEVFQYSNLLAGAAGFLAAHVLYPGRELGAGYDLAMQSLVFRPLGMRTATLDLDRGLRAPDRAAGHSWRLDGETGRVAMEMNRAIVPLRPAGGAWASANDVVRYLQLELARGKLPDGTQLVGANDLLARRDKQVAVGEDAEYGMGLAIDHRYGIPVVHHGGALFGFKTDMMFLPDHGVGAVILTNSDEGQALLAPFRRRLLELLFDGRPEAEEDLATAARVAKEALAKERERMVVPADPAVVAGLAPRYRQAALGEIQVSSRRGAAIFDFGEWKSEMASRKNDDGTVSLVTVAPGLVGLPFVVGDKDGARTLTLRDAQHEYVFTEAR